MFYLTALLLAGAALTAWAGQNVNHGYAWTDQFCRSNGAILCENPQFMLFAAVGVGLIAVFRYTLR